LLFGFGTFAMLLLPAEVGAASPKLFARPTDLGTLGGTNSGAGAVNGSGQVVGESDTTGNTAAHAFSWTSSGGMVDLGTLGGTNSGAVAVNASGQVIGDSQTTGDTESHAFSWTSSGGMVDLGTLGGTSSHVGGFGSVAGPIGGGGVNDSGQVVGNSSTTGDTA